MKGGVVADRDFFWHYPHYGNQGGEPSSIIRSKEWKLIHYYEDGRDELYNLTDDIGEQTDRAARHPEKVSTMRKRLEDWLPETGAHIPQSDSRFDAAKKKIQMQQIHDKKMPSLEKQAENFRDPNWKPNADWWGSAAKE